MAYRMVNKINEEWCFIDDNGNYVGDVGPRGERLGSGPISLTAAEIATPTAAILADTTATYIRSDGSRWYSNGSILVGLSSSSIGGAITSITYNGSGQITNYTDSGIAYVIAYNGDGTVNTVTSSGVTRTVAYNGDGTVATYQ